MVRGWRVGREYERSDRGAGGARVRGKRSAEVREGDIEVGEVASGWGGVLDGAEELEVREGRDICEEGY